MMTFLTWLLNDYFQYLISFILISGVFGCLITFLFLDKIAKFFPPILPYEKLLKFLSIILLLSGTYLQGSFSTEKKWLAKNKELEIKLAAAEEKSKEVTVQIVEKVVTKTKIIREKGNNVIQYIDREIPKYDATCPVPAEVIKALNAAAKGEDVK